MAAAGAILFDWGNTLMRDDAAARGPMALRGSVEAMPGAAAALALLSSRYPCYLATGATESTREQIITALSRAGLAQWLSGIFIAAELGCRKDKAEFYLRVAAALQLPPQRLVMIGNDLNDDIGSARQAGLHAFWVPETGTEADGEQAFSLDEAAKVALAALACH